MPAYSLPSQRLLESSSRASFRDSRQRSQIPASTIIDPNTTRNSQSREGEVPSSPVGPLSSAGILAATGSSSRVGVADGSGGRERLGVASIVAAMVGEAAGLDKATGMGVAVSVGVADGVGLGV